MKHAPTFKKAFTLTEIMLVVALIAFLLAIAIPSFFAARERSRQTTCQENLTKIDGTKQQWALETNATIDLIPTWDDLVGESLYLRRMPICPASGVYTIGNLDQTPTCTHSTNVRYPHVFPNGS